ncbi:MAG: SGNH/GDSL hydrolase family protein, partial [Gammaproteobacteria bacterium]
MKPGFNLRGDQNRLYPGVDIRINSLGMRGAEPDGRPPILLVGDSVAFGFGVQEDVTVSSMLQQKLTQKFQVMNGGVPGYNMEQIADWTLELVNELKPRLVVVLMNANDAQPRYYPYWGGLTVSRFRCYPWETDLPKEAPLTEDKYDHWLLPVMYKLIKSRVFKVRDLPDVLGVKPKTEEDKIRHKEAERRALDFWNSGDLD